MAHFAKVQEGIVIKVIVAESDFFKHLLIMNPENGYKQVIIQEVVNT